jgi:hypothetical protein
VIATVGSEGQAGAALEAGADHALNYRADNVAAASRRYRASRGWARGWAAWWRSPSGATSGWPRRCWRPTGRSPRPALPFCSFPATQVTAMCSAGRG